MSTSTLVTAPVAKKRVREAADLPPRSIAPGPISRTFGIIGLVLATIYFLAPVVWVMIASTKNNRDLTTSFGFWFADWNLATNYEGLMSWTKGLFWQWVGNSLFYSTAA